MNRHEPANTGKIAIYARVSSQRQKDEETIDSQLEALKVFAKENNYSLHEKFVFLDNGVSGSTLQRPALDKLRDVIRHESIKTVLMYSPDRLSRNYTHQLILMEEFRRHGANICFLKNPPEVDTPEGKMFQHFQGIFAEYERALFLDRSRRGRIYKAKQGDPSVIPKVPFGYRKLRKDDRSSVVVVEEEAAIVKEIFRLYLHESHSYYDVAQKITESGIKTIKGGLRWDESTIRGILKNPTYLGVSYFGKTEKCQGESDRIRKCASKTYLKPVYAKKNRPEEEWIPIQVPQIINESDFEMVQERIKMNAARSPRNTNKPSLLQGLVTCGECGQPFYKRERNNGKKAIGYYNCRGLINKKYKKCSNKSLRQDKIDALVFAEVLQLLNTPDLIEKELTRRAKESSNTEELEQREIIKKKELLKIICERDRLLDAYQSGILDLQELKKRNLKLDTGKKSLEKDIAALHALKFEIENNFEFTKVFESTLEKIKSKANGLSFEEKRKLLRLVVEQVIVYSDSITVVHCISPRLMAQEKCLLELDGV